MKSLVVSGVVCKLSLELVVLWFGRGMQSISGNVMVEELDDGFRRLPDVCLNQLY